MQKLKMASARLQWVVIVFMLLSPVALVVSILTQGWAEFLELPAGVMLDESRVKGLGLIVMVGLGSMTTLVHLLAFWLLYKLLNLYKRGIIFTAANVAAIRHIGWALISIDLVHMLKILITGPTLTYFDMTSPHMSAGIRIAFLIVGFFIVLISYVIDMGRDLKEQDALVI